MQALLFSADHAHRCQGVQHITMWGCRERVPFAAELTSQVCNISWELQEKPGTCWPKSPNLPMQTLANISPHLDRDNICECVPLRLALSTNEEEDFSKRISMSCHTVALKPSALGIEDAHTLAMLVLRFWCHDADYCAHGSKKIVEVRLNDQGPGAWCAASLQRREEELRLLYSSVVVRAVNGLTGFEQKVGIRSS